MKRGSQVVGDDVASGQPAGQIGRLGSAPRVARIPPGQYRNASGSPVFMHPSIEHSPAGFTMSPKISTQPARRLSSAPRPPRTERAIPQHGEPVCSVGGLCAELQPVRATDLDQVLRRARARPVVQGDGRLRAIRQLAHLPDVPTVLEPTDARALRHPRSIPPRVGEWSATPAELLAAWQAAERRYAKAAAGSGEAATLHAEMHRLTVEYEWAVRGRVAPRLKAPARRR